MKKIPSFALCLTLAAALSACGGNGDDSTSPDNGSGGGTASGSPSSSDAASICAGTAASTTQYDTFLNTVAGIAQSSASRTVSVYGQGTDSKQCYSIAASTAQADTAVVQAVTTDAWDNAISYFDPVGTTTGGGSKFNQQLLVTCASGGDTFKHVAIANPASASTLVAADQDAAVSGQSLVSYECASSSGAQFVTSQKITFNSDGSALVVDPTNGNTTFSAADVTSLFSPAGYAKSSDTTLHWTLYQLPVGSTTKQVLVHTRQSSSDGENIDLFVTND